MTIQHNIIADPDIHEPKGVATAASNSLYVANGSGSGVWTVPAPLAGFPSALDGHVFIADGAGGGSWTYPVEGQDTALDGEVFISDGAGGGAWASPTDHPIAEIYVAGGTTVHTLAAASAYTLLNPVGEWTEGVTNVLTTTPGSGHINLEKAGNYYISFWANFTTASVSTGSAYTFKYSLDGVLSTRQFQIAKFTNGADQVAVAASGIVVTATAGQELAIYAAGDGTSSSTNITVTEAGLQALYLS